jgi:hypothetical protein
MCLNSIGTRYLPVRYVPVLLVHVAQSDGSMGYTCQATNGETLFFYATPYPHWAYPSNVMDVAATFLSTTL